MEFEISDRNLPLSKVSSVEFDHNMSPRVIVTVTSGDRYSILWEDDMDEVKYKDHSLVIYNILLAAMSNQNLRISGTFEPVTSQEIKGKIKSLKISLT